MSLETEYFSKDFEWEELKEEVENDPSMRYHLIESQSSTSSPSQDSEAWKRFHTRHSTGKFFKERRYLLKEFPELISRGDCSKVLEVGCGNGSTTLPLLRGKRDMIVYACDSSTEALERAKEVINTANIDSVKQQFHPFYCDFSITGFPKWLACDSCRQNFLHGCFSDERIQLSELSDSPEVDFCIGGVDFVTLIFTLSALPLHKMPTAIKECFSVLKPGGLLLFRDYGLYDMTMLRFEPDKKVGFREYMRSDGTRSYFFCLDTVRDVFVGAGFTEVELEYCCVKSVNRRKGKSMRRVWVHGKFQKPS